MKTRVHRTAAVGFGRTDAVAAYERARPSFPPEAIDFLVDTLRLEPGRRLADLGAGTGKLTRLLVPHATVVGVEPVAEMRHSFAVALPEVPLVGALAESLPFHEGVFDAVVAAQAFHWFDGPAALTEIHRVLRRDGRLALVWNRRDERVPWVKQLTDLVERFRGDTPAQASLAWRAAVDSDRRFAPLQHVELPYVHELSVDGVVDRVASVSFIAALPDDERARLLDEVRGLATQQDEPVALPYRTHVYWTERR